MLRKKSNTTGLPQKLKALKRPERNDVLREIAIGVAELDAGLGIPHDKVVAKFKARRHQWKKMASRRAGK